MLIINGSFSHWHRDAGCMSGVTLKPGWKPFKQITFDLRAITVFLCSAASETGALEKEQHRKRMILTAYDSDPKWWKICCRDVSLRYKSALCRPALQGRDKDSVILLYRFAWSFIGLFWRTGSSCPRCFTMTSRALASANLDMTLSLTIPPKLCQFFPNLRCLHPLTHVCTKAWEWNRDSLSAAAVR